MPSKMDEGRERRRLLKDIPRWFCIASYQRAGLLDAIGWYQQISVRRVCSHQLSDMRQPEPIFPDWDGPIQQALGSLREKPICDLSCSPFDHAAFSFIQDLMSPQAPVVRSMTLRDLYRIDRSVRGTLTQDQIDLAQRMASDQSPRGGLSFLRHAEWMDATVDDECLGRTYVPLMLDLNFPNSVLKEHFEKHLQSLRRHPKGKPEDSRKKTPDFREWTKFRLLACMDLLMAADEQGSRISNRLLADALGSDESLEELDEEKVRKTIRPLGMELLHPYLQTAVHTRLRALAYASQSKRDRRGAGRHKKPA